ncbi:hypothetical protein TVAG_388140 [Trichomonas vaginalis G3]|uniref:Uncharacterized protein n=1 Tax=Trichomonas vaginalis (strain ATCC PRA-98 / G3) TaxID=412133 RepID=A2E140_TRIV3|nr:hypothetical protein TVAGG3_0330820 [Trichomonas vaginalis G3]EAY13672.1 hypothetical protein TVAG_388140 [Trichomonas vaginalis G3]KAI5529947.1 hypothetical protein TVAGG3_0330820 [Trichomonas vaginalis G3]|eukprot:XP_001325895.1 hypothetical protein [Trichomonas vaginalis G3]
MFVILFQCLTLSSDQIPDIYATIPDECSSVMYSATSEFELQANTKTCFYTKPGFFFGKGFILEIFWQENNNNGGFMHLGPTRNGAIVNVKTDFVYVLITTCKTQKIKYYPSTSLSYSYSVRSGIEYVFHTYFSTKEVSNYTVSMQYSSASNKTTYIYNSLLVLGDNVSLSNQPNKEINTNFPESTISDASNPQPTLNSDGSLGLVSFKDFQTINSIENEVRYENQVSATLNAISGIPSLSGEIPFAPSISMFSEIDSSYVEQSLESPEVTDYKRDEITPTPLSKEFPITLVLGVVLAVLAIVIVIILVRKHFSPKVDGADQNSEDISGNRYYSTEVSDSLYSQSGSYGSSINEKSSEKANSLDDASGTQGDNPAPL